MKRRGWSAKIVFRLRLFVLLAALFAETWLYVVIRPGDESYYAKRTAKVALSFSQHSRPSSPSPAPIPEHDEMPAGADLQMTETQRSAARRIAEHSRPPVTTTPRNGAARHVRSRSASGGLAHSETVRSHASQRSSQGHRDGQGRRERFGSVPRLALQRDHDRRSSHGGHFGSHPRVQSHHRSQSERGLPSRQVFRQDDDVMSVRSYQSVRSTYSRAPSVRSTPSLAKAPSVHSVPPPVPVPEVDLKMSMSGERRVVYAHILRYLTKGLVVGGT